jgi:thiamine pyrophosphate-dependent acetolactate synthase large subunit-like protein
MNGIKDKLDRRDVVRLLLENRNHLLVISGLGSPSYDVISVEDNAHDFPLWGAMGGAALMGLGLAMARPNQRVLVITGDGEMLMGLGGLGTIANKAPDNLAIVVLDNERYGETGMQETHTAGRMNLAAVAAGAGFPAVGTIRTDSDLFAAIPIIREQAGPIFYDIKVSTASSKLIPQPQDGIFLKERFRTSLGL